MRRDEVKAAFIEGAKLAVELAADVAADPEMGSPDLDNFELERAWHRSDARKRLEKPLAD